MLSTDYRMIHKVFNVFYFLARPLVKWFLHRFTNLCELQRICYGCPPGALRTRKVQNSLELSRRPREEIQTRAVGTILQVKKINSKVHVDFPRTFGACAEKIWRYKRLCWLVEQRRSTQYDCNDAGHEAKLISLWKLLMGEDKLKNRVSEQWQDIGFQGDDPKTDFRGMGMLGLDNLVFFSREYNGTARHLLSHSHHPTRGYFFAIVGINLTSMAYHLLTSGAARNHFYNQPRLTMDAFHQFYCYLFFEFDRYWVECKPKSIMDFSWIQKKFDENIRKLLSNNSCCFKMNLAVESI
ncbi:ELMO domain-containing protein 2 isoform X2 [Wyeomyia smithii]|uniref:ELMO domain-containing protein 2 isoform X2 n=1 Tax=Wyeomyia smithii TaxID=174621 RepID=UPI002467EB63|nr:ELMO domain-containing protein 2 isoform X2 [Wyeomyia smithii]